MTNQKISDNSIMQINKLIKEIFDDFESLILNDPVSQEKETNFIMTSVRSFSMLTRDILMVSNDKTSGFTVAILVRVLIEIWVDTIYILNDQSEDRLNAFIDHQDHEFLREIDKLEEIFPNIQKEYPSTIVSDLRKSIPNPKLKWKQVNLEDRMKDVDSNQKYKGMIKYINYIYSIISRSVHFNSSNIASFLDTESMVNSSMYYHHISLYLVPVLYLDLLGIYIDKSLESKPNELDFIDARNKLLKYNEKINKINIET